MTDSTLKTLAAALCAAVIAHTPVMADDRNDQPGSTDISMEDAREAVEDAGYTRISGMEFDDGAWEVEAHDSEGRAVDVKVDATTGEIIKIDR